MQNFTGNVLTEGRTGYGKTYFTQKLAANKFSCKLKRAQGVLYIDLDKEKEAEIESSFFCNVDFHYPKLTEQFENIL